jgi:hypothetical protein
MSYLCHVKEDGLSAKFPDLSLTRDILLLRYQMALVVESG